jgi:hypothetical protein
MGLTFRLGQIPLAIQTDTSNNVGIGGAANASFKLQVTGATNLTGALSGTSGTFTSSVTFGANNRGFIREPAGDVEIGGTTGAALKLYSNGVEYAKIAPSTGFTTTLPFGGTSATFSSSVTANGSFNGYQSGTQNLLIDWSGSSQMVTLTNTELFFGTNAQRRMTITNGGNVGIGTNAPAKTFVVSAAVSTEVAQIYNTRNNSNGDYVLTTFLGINSNNTNCYHHIAVTGSADKFYVYGNGNVVNTNGSYGTLSDATLKENIVDATPKLSDLLKLKVRNFNLIADEDKTKQIGFIAQEFEEVFPAMVDTDGKTNMKTIKTSVLVPMLVKAIQEQQAQIEELKAIVATK